ncbi:MAG: hypothetical protein JKY56_02640 [Kofleriaceae bacterium]|nr:hypothetical protein [Kofleriaceae bacterium]
MRSLNSVSCLPLIAAIISGCSPVKGNTVVVPVAAAPEPAPQISPLDTLKNADFQTLSDLAAPWIQPAKGGSVSESLSNLQGRLAILETMNNDNSLKLALSLDMLMKLMALEVSLESATCDSDCLDSRIASYRILLLWKELFALSIGQGLFDGALDVLEIHLPPDKKEELRQFIYSVARVSEQNWRNLSVFRVRMKSTSSARKVALLEELAQAESRRSEYRNAAGLYSLALTLGTKDEQRNLRRQLAINCYRELNVECGARERKAAESRTAKNAEQDVDQSDSDYLTLLEKVQTAASRISRNDTSTVEARLQSGYDYIDLSRYSDANKIFRELEKESPRDARPIVGLASVIIDDGFRIGKAHTLLLQARGFTHREVGYYELRIGTWFEGFKILEMGNSSKSPEPVLQYLSQQLAELEEAIEEYAKLEPDKGQALRQAMSIGEVLIQLQLGTKQQEDLRKAIDLGIPAVSQLVLKQGPSLYLRRLQLVLSRFDLDGKRALASVGASEAIAELSDMYLQLRFALVMVHDVGLKEFASDSQQGTSFVARDLRSAALAALALEKKGIELWKQVEVLLEDLVRDAPDEDSRFRLTNNLAVVQFRLGKVGDAQGVLRSILKDRTKISVASINALAMDSSAGAKEFASLSEEAMSELWPGARVTARHWIARKAKGRKLTAKERAGLAASVSQKIGKRVFGDRGVLLEQDFHLGVGYSSVDKLAFELDMKVRPWLVLPASE